MMSLFFPETGALFLHVPRTAGRWVYFMVGRCGIKTERWHGSSSKQGDTEHTLLAHYDADRFRMVKYRFAFVRYPFDSYASFWRCVKSGVGRHSSRVERFLSSPIRLSNEAFYRWRSNFDEWLNCMLEEEPGWLTRLYERFVGPERNEFCHYIGRTETLKDDLGEVLNVLGYSKQWRNGRRASPLRRRKAWNMEDHVPRVKLTEKQKTEILRSERVLIRRFYGEETESRRFYRDDDGWPTWRGTAERLNEIANRSEKAETCR